MGFRTNAGETLNRLAHEHQGTLGWVGLAAGVIAFDLLAEETLSGAVDRALETDTGKLLALGGVAVTGAHLLNMLPERYDPFVQGFRLLDKARETIWNDQN